MSVKPIKRKLFAFSFCSFLLIAIAFAESDLQKVQDANSTSESSVSFEQLRIKAEEGNPDAQYKRRNPKLQ